MTSSIAKTQQPGEYWTFRKRTTKEEVSGILPAVRGENNAFAYWKSRAQHPFGGYWISRKFVRDLENKWAKENRKKKAAYNKLYKENDPLHPEIKSVWHHYYCIFKPTTQRKNYVGMPFFDSWNPQKGGSIKAGAIWIIENLGKRPKGCSLHIVDHARGFVPGNLEWTFPRKQSTEQMFKIIADQRHRIKELEEQLRIFKNIGGGLNDDLVRFTSS
jgi:hypothetical protein